MFNGADRQLLLRLTERELFARFAGSALGISWAILGPLLSLAIYSFVFGQLFQQRMGDLGTDSYTLFVAIGLWPWMMFADSILRATQSLPANAALVKKVAFPHLLLILASICGVFILHLTGFVVVLSVLAYSGTAIKLAGLPLAVAAILTIFAFALAGGAFLAALQTLLRDVEQAIPPAMMMLYFLTPVLYPIGLIPLEVRHWISWNPLASVMQRLRDGLLLGADIQFGDVLTLLIGVAFAFVGVLFFNRLSPYFEDFL